MRGRFRVRPSKASSAMQLPMAVVFVIIGLVWVIPTTREDGVFILFGVLWTLLAVAAVAYHGANLLGMSIPGMLTVEPETDPEVSAPPDFETALRKLDGLRADGLISEEEYGRKRAEIIERQW